MSDSMIAAIKLVRTDSENADFRALVKALDAELAIRDGADHPFYDQFNKLDAIRHVVVAYAGARPVSCGAFKPYDAHTVEIKRMFTAEAFRSRGIAASVLAELERWATECGYAAGVLETGIKQPEAIRLYEKSGYQRIPNYGQYANVPASVCMKKELNRSHAPSGYWERSGLAEAILAALKSEGKNPETLTPDDLEPYDQFHGGGKAMTILLAQAVSLRPGMHVLDVGGGLGGPARTLASKFGCDVTVADPTESYLHAGSVLTELLRLHDRVRFVRADALDLPFADADFDVIWTQNSGMNIAGKERLYAEFRRVLRPGGRLAIQEPMAGPNWPPHYPLMWAADPSTNFLRTSDEMKQVIEQNGFRMTSWADQTAVLTELRAQTTYPARGIQLLVMGEKLAEISAATKRNTEEQRVLLMQGVFQG